MADSNLNKVIKSLRKPRKRQQKRQQIMGKEGAHAQDRRRVKAGGHKAKETIRRVGEYKRAKKRSK